MKQFKFTINGNSYSVDILSVEDNIASVEVNGTTYSVKLDKEVVVPVAPKTPVLVRPEEPKPTPKEQRIVKTPVKTSNVAVKSPLPGTITSVEVKEGDTVTMGQLLLKMEAMKMENSVVAEKDGTVSSIRVKAGDTVLQNDILLEIQ
jgi:biotin carboxyl carrier protein